MIIFYFRRFISVSALILICCAGASILEGQGSEHAVPAKPIVPSAIADSDADHIQQRDEWFVRGRLVPGKPSAELRRRAYQAKLQMRALRAAELATARANGTLPPSAGAWTPLGPVPLASDASGNGTQNYNQVAGRATAVAIDPADSSGNTVYIGGAQGGVWQSTNAASSTANSVTWTPLTDDQASLSIGALAIQPGNTDPTQSVILAATGEADNSSDSYFGVGILRSADGGNTWNLISTANGGALFFNGLGGTEMAFSTAGQMNTVVSAMATASEGVVAGAVTANTERGLYTSLDAGQTWTYDALTDPDGPTDATSATSVAYNASAGLFFAAIRYHGFYSSPDGVSWTRLAVQPGSGLTTAACPPQSASNNQTCPIYRAEIAVVPGRNEMYAWFVHFSSGETVVDGGIWQSLNGGSSWNSISDAGIKNCGDVDGCGVQQGSYNLGLLAVPNLAGTDLYAGGVNLYKCSINPQNPACVSPAFMNLTHAYGCVPIAAPAHVHPDQHALAYTIPTLGNDSGNALLYFANDGGIYRALNGFAGLSTGSCSGTNQFDDLNQNLGSMTQFVSFSQHPTDPNTLLGGSQDNGSPATNQATSNAAWGNLLGGDGGYNAIDPIATSNFYATNPDFPPGGLGVQLCPNGVNCIDSAFNFVVTSDVVGGDDGAFYFPFILDPQSATALLVGTCRVWRGPRTGGTYTVLSPNFDTLSSGTCSGDEVNLVSAIAAGGPTDNNGSTVVYATTSGLGPINGPLNSPAGGNVWVTTHASDGPTSFANMTSHGPQGSINPNQFPISSVAIDASDLTGSTAYVTVMGFTAPPGSSTGPGHVWKTMNAGASWADFTANLPDAPANAVIVDSTNANVYVGTDVGVFVTSTGSANWTEVGPNPGPEQSGFLPNAAVTALALFNSGGLGLVRASTYGRGMWQFNLNTTPGYQIAVSNSPLTAFSGQIPGFTGIATEVNGYASSVTMSCVAGATPPPSTCNIPQSPFIPGNKTPFSVTVGGADGSYSFNVQGVGSDTNEITQQIPVTLNLVSFALTTPTPSTLMVPDGTTSAPVDFQVTAGGSFNQSVTLSCNPNITGATCTLTPGTTVNPTPSSPVNVTATVTVPAGTAHKSYNVTLQATAAGSSAPITALFTVKVTTNPNFVLSEASAFPEVNVGSTGTSGPIAITSQDGFSGTVTLSCPTTFGVGSCSVSPTTIMSFPATATLTINGTSFATGTYSLSIAGTSGSVTNSIAVAFDVGDYSISGTQTLIVPPAGQGTANLTLTSVNFYAGKITATCDPSALAGALCTLSPVNPISVASRGSAGLTATINVPNNASPGNYPIQINTQDTTGAPSHSVTVTLTVGQAFIVVSSPPNQSQTVNPGQTSGPYNLSVQPVGASFDAAVTLNCSGLPAFARCLFNPAAPVTPGNSATTVVATISTAGSAAAAQRRVVPHDAGRDDAVRRGAVPHAGLRTLTMLLPGIVIGWFALGSTAKRRHEKRRTTVCRWFLGLGSIGLLYVLLLPLPSCGGASSGGGGGGNQSTPPGTYTITVTGTSPGAGSAFTSVTLIVN